MKTCSKLVAATFFGTLPVKILRAIFLRQLEMIWNFYGFVPCYESSGQISNVACTQQSSKSQSLCQTSNRALGMSKQHHKRGELLHFCVVRHRMPRLQLYTNKLRILSKAHWHKHLSHLGSPPVVFSPPLSSLYCSCSSVPAFLHSEEFSIFTIPIFYFFFIAGSGSELTYRCADQHSPDW